MFAVQTRMWEYSYIYIYIYDQTLKNMGIYFLRLKPDEINIFETCLFLAFFEGH